MKLFIELATLQRNYLLTKKKGRQKKALLNSWKDFPLAFLPQGERDK